MVNRVWNKCGSRRGERAGRQTCCVHYKPGLNPGEQPIKTIFCCFCGKSMVFPFPQGLRLPKPAAQGAHGEFAEHYPPARPEDVTHVP